jgi:aromatic-L-amino-acid/L-tryptophan decarboxylase
VLLDTVRDVISQYSRHSAHPRMFGYVASPGTAVTALSHMIAAAMNINVTAWRSAPSAADLERLTIDWLKEMLGYPATAGGLLLSGGSMANFAGLAAARSAKAGVDVVRDGVAAAAGACACTYPRNRITRWPKRRECSGWGNRMCGR